MVYIETEHIDLRFLNILLNFQLLSFLYLTGISDSGKAEII